MAFAYDICISHSLKQGKMKKKKKISKKMFGHFICVQSYIAWHIASDICSLIWNRDAEQKRVLHPIKASERPSDERR